MEKFLRAAAHFTKNMKPLKIQAKPKLLFLTCMDSRLQPHSLTGAVPGDSFVARNPGNFVPHAQLPDELSTCSEAAALEVAVVMAGVEHIVVCGHSDCKALHHLLNTRDHENQTSFCTKWVHKQASHSLMKLDQIEKNIHDQKGKSNFKLKFSGEKEDQNYDLVIDEDNELLKVDKLSQISVIQQLLNLKSYEFIQERLHKGTLNIHGWWVNLGKNEIFVYSQKHEKFILMNEETLATFI